jgi:hypothetical protein
MRAGSPKVGPCPHRRAFIAAIHLHHSLVRRSTHEQLLAGVEDGSWCFGQGVAVVTSGRQRDAETRVFGWRLCTQKYIRPPRKLDSLSTHAQQGGARVVHRQLLSATRTCCRRESTLLVYIIHRRSTVALADDCLGRPTVRCAENA